MKCFVENTLGFIQYNSYFTYTNLFSVKPDLKIFPFHSQRLSDPRDNSEINAFWATFATNLSHYFVSFLRDKAKNSPLFMRKYPRVF